MQYPLDRRLYLHLLQVSVIVSSSVNFPQVHESREGSPQAEPPFTVHTEVGYEGAASEL